MIKSKKLIHKFISLVKILPYLKAPINLSNKEKCRKMLAFSYFFFPVTFFFFFMDLKFRLYKVIAETGTQKKEMAKNKNLNKWVLHIKKYRQQKPDLGANFYHSFKLFLSLILENIIISCLENKNLCSTLR